MAYASRSGRARTSTTSPAAFSVCDRCGIWHNFRNLQWQFEWRGAALMNTYLLVCCECLDTPQEQLRSLTLPADPVPIPQARVEAFGADETTTMSLTPATTDPVTGIPIPNTTVMTTVTGSPMTPLPYGRPISLSNDAVMPQSVDNVAYGEVLPILSLIAVGTPVVTATCSVPHGLATDDQVAVEGVSNGLAAGFFSITVTSATAFTYETYSPVPSGSLLTSGTRVVTCLVGLPYNYAEIQQVGP